MSKHTILSKTLQAKIDYIYPIFDKLIHSKIRHYTLKGEARKKPSYTEHESSSLKGSLIKLEFILIYLKYGSHQIVQGALFELSQAKVNDWIKYLLPVLEEALYRLKVLPIMGDSLFYKKQYFLDYLSTDVTEIPIPRKSDYEAQKEDYSGKKKQHTLKYLSFINNERKVLFLSHGYEGRVHDKTIFDELSVNTDALILADLGFYGADKENKNIVIPYKKPKGKELEKGKKEANKRMSSMRVKVEHVFGYIKKLHIIGRKNQLRTEGIRDKLMLIGAGLYNLSLILKQTC